MHFSRKITRHYVVSYIVAIRVCLPQCHYLIFFKKKILLAFRKLVYNRVLNSSLQSRNLFIVFKFYVVFNKFNINDKHILQPRLIDIVQRCAVTCVSKVLYILVYQYVISGFIII